MTDIVIENNDVDVSTLPYAEDIEVFVDKGDDIYCEVANSADYKVAIEYREIEVDIIGQTIVHNYSFDVEDGNTLSIIGFSVENNNTLVIDECS